MSLVYNCSDLQQRAAGLTAARTAVKNGDLAVIPTDTVYGLGCDAFHSVGVRALLAAKNRGRDMPIPVLVSSWNSLDGLVVGVPPLARTLVEAFWPGALSIIITHAPSLRWDLGDSHGTVMVRMPAHPVALELISEIGPMAVSSANISGQPPATTALEAQEQLASRVAVYLDGGPALHGQASTIVDLSDSAQQTPAGLRIVRVGAIGIPRLAEVLGVGTSQLVSRSGLSSGNSE